MDRIGFIKTCAMTCICGSAITTLAQSCSASIIVGGNIIGDELIVSLKNFDPDSGNDISFRKYIIIQNEMLQYPVCVYRFNENEYSALWMRCTHQGNELQIFGDKLQCPAHGSEFNNKGGVQNGPADKGLRVFPVTIEKKQIRISLKAV